MRFARPTSHRSNRLRGSCAGVIERLESRWMLAAFPAPLLAVESDTGMSSSDGITSDNTPLIHVDIPKGTPQRIWATVVNGLNLTHVEIDPLTGAATGRQIVDNWNPSYGMFGTATSEDRLYTLGTTGQNDPIELRTYDLATGALLSQAQVAITIRPAAGLAYLNGKLYASDTMGIVAIDPSNGAVLYRKDVFNGMLFGLPGANLAAAPEQNALYSINLHRSLIKIDPVTGSVLQEVRNVDNTGMVSGLAYSRGKLYASTYLNAFFTLDAATGQRLSTGTLPVPSPVTAALGGDGLSGDPYYKVFDGGVQLGSGFGMTPAFQAPALADGTHNLVVKYYSPGGALLGESDPLVLQIDTQAPAMTPAAAVLDASSDTGISSSDGITADTTPLLNVAVPTGVYYQVYSDGALVSGYESAAQFQMPELSAGTHVITVKYADAAGNLSKVSRPTVLRILSGAPAQPGAPTLDPSSDTGAAADSITSDSTPLLNVAAPTAQGELLRLIFKGPASTNGAIPAVQYLLDPKTNAIVGQTPLISSPLWDPTLGAALGDGLLYMISTTTNYYSGYNSLLSAFNADNGALIYQVTLPTTITDAAGLAFLNGKLYVAGRGMLYNIDPFDGSVLGAVYPYQWNPPVYTAIGNNLTGAQDLGRLFAVDWMSQLMSIDPTTGSSTLVRKLASADMLISGMAYADNELVTVTYEGLLRHYSPSTGDVLSTVQLPKNGLYSAMAGEGAATPGKQLYWRVFADGVQVSGDYETGSSFQVPELADGEHAITIAYVDAAGNVSAVSDALTVRIDTAAPAVQSVRVSDGSAQRSMVNSVTVTFSEPVALSADAFRLLLLDGSAVPGTSVLCTNPSGDAKTYVLTFAGDAVMAGSLADGQYKLMIAGQSDVAGNTGADESASFARLFGDADGDGMLSQPDHQALADVLSSRNGQDDYAWYFDVDGSGTITGRDMSEFSRRFAGA